MSDVSTEAILEALKAKLRIASDSRLAREIGVPRSTLATWRKRGTIPGEAFIRLDEQFELTFYDGMREANMLYASDHLTLALFLKLHEEGIRLGGYVDENVDRMKWANIGAKAVSVFDKQMSDVQRDRDVRQIHAVRLMSAIDTDYASKVVAAYEAGDAVPPIPLPSPGPQKGPRGDDEAA